MQACLGAPERAKVGGNSSGDALRLLSSKRLHIKMSQKPAPGTILNPNIVFQSYSNCAICRGLSRSQAVSLSTRSE